MISTRRGVLAAVTTLAALAAAGLPGQTSATSAPEGAGEPYAIDASGCPEDATTPLPDGEPIRMGITLTMSGPGSAPQIAEGMQAYFAQVNADGGVDGRQLEVTVKDDAFDSARAVANITEFIQADHVFAIAAQQGSANIVAAQPVVEEACMPQFFVPAGLPEFGDPANHPWTSTSLLAYDTEANLWAKFLDEQFPDGAKVAMLVFNSAFGPVYVDTLTAALEGTSHEIVETKLHEATAVNVDNEMTALVAAGPDVIIAATAGAACPQAMTAAANAGFEGALVISALCFGIDAFFVPAGDAANGVYQIQSFKDPSDPAYAEDEDVQAYIAAVGEFGPDGTDPMNGFVAAGYRNAAALVEMLKLAAASPEGLTRVALANAVWNINFTTPLSQPGVSFVMNGPADAYPVESGTMFQYDAAAGSMVSTGLTLSAEGETGSFQG